jgi:hypothetical protein
MALSVGWRLAYIVWMLRMDARSAYSMSRIYLLCELREGGVLWSHSVWPLLYDIASMLGMQSVHLQCAATAQRQGEDGSREHGTQSHRLTRTTERDMRRRASLWPAARVWGATGRGAVARVTL